jgi:hypothetical protein
MGCGNSMENFGQIPVPGYWASIVQRILSYKGTNGNSPDSLSRKGNKIISITSDMISTII